MMEAVWDRVVEFCQNKIIFTDHDAGPAKGRCLYIDSTSPEALEGPGRPVGRVIDCKSLPPTGPLVVRLVIVSDTHERHDALTPLPRGDILLHCGDITMAGRLRSEAAARRTYKSFNSFLARNAASGHAVVVGGNHDYWLGQFSAAEVASLLPNATLLHDSSTTLCGLHIHGSPASRGMSSNRAFQLPPVAPHSPHPQSRSCLVPHPETAAHRPAEEDGPTCDILMTHGPPSSFALLSERHRLLGVVDGDGLPKASVLHAFGHIHPSYGAAVADNGGAIQINASTMNGQRAPHNPPVVVDVLRPPEKASPS